MHYACGDTLQQTEESPAHRDRVRERNKIFIYCVITPQCPLLVVNCCFKKSLNQNYSGAEKITTSCQSISFYDHGLEGVQF